jgi:hypothetical protein
LQPPKLQDLEDFDESLLKKKKVADHPIGFDLALQVTHNLVNLDDDLVQAERPALLGSDEVIRDASPLAIFRSKREFQAG